MSRDSWNNSGMILHLNNIRVLNMLLLVARIIDKEKLQTIGIQPFWSKHKHVSWLNEWLHFGAHSASLTFDCDYDTPINGQHLCVCRVSK